MLTYVGPKVDTGLRLSDGSLVMPESMTQAEIGEMIAKYPELGAFYRRFSTTSSNALQLGSEMVSHVIQNEAIAPLLKLPYGKNVFKIWKRLALKNGQVDTNVRFLAEADGCIVIDTASLVDYAEQDVLEIIYDYFVI